MDWMAVVVVVERTDSIAVGYRGCRLGHTGCQPAGCSHPDCNHCTANDKLH